MVEKLKSNEIFLNIFNKGGCTIRIGSDYKLVNDPDLIVRIIKFLNKNLKRAKPKTPDSKVEEKGR